ncbi:MAG: hypothetical protein IPJ18_13125 [Betaproteobacteria bacterium]|nr:hypothetical protein [Betaproteobacteria bacterium]
MVATTGFEQWQVCQADLQVALDGSNVRTELIGQLNRVKVITLIEFDQYVR